MHCMAEGASDVIVAPTAERPSMAFHSRYDWHGTAIAAERSSMLFRSDHNWNEMVVPLLMAHRPFRSSDFRNKTAAAAEQHLNGAQQQQQCAQQEEYDTTGSTSLHEGKYSLEFPCAQQEDHSTTGSIPCARSSPATPSCASGAPPMRLSSRPR